MIQDACILVASESAADAKLVSQSLRDAYKNVHISTDRGQAVADFAKHEPDVLVLAFDSLEKAERYYLGLYRYAETVPSIIYRTVVLCREEEAPRAYEACRKDIFDDYIVFWPTPPDPSRLLMAMHHAITQMSSLQSTAPTTQQMAKKVRKLAQIPNILEEQIARGTQNIQTSRQLLTRVETDIGISLDKFSRTLNDNISRETVGSEVPTGVQQDFDRMQSEEFARHLRAIGTVTKPLQQWISSLRESMAPQLQAAIDLQTMADRIRPQILVVDDDEFQQKLAARLLQEMFEVILATSGESALSILRKYRPDLILMDFVLPDIDGVETTRRIKAVKAFASIPILILTGNSQKQVVIDSFEAGATDFLVKPLDRKTMNVKIRKILAMTGAPDKKTGDAEIDFPQEDENKGASQ